MSESSHELHLVRDLNSPDYEARVRAALDALGIPLDLIRERSLPLCIEAQSLVVAEIDARGREHRLTPVAAAAWTTMKAAAAKRAIGLYLVSAFRTFDRQCEILRNKLDAGQALEQILSVSAPPGFSEHHTGRAVDIGATPDDQLEEDFAGSEAYSWLSENASRFGYFLSYPLGNPHGYRYEPWHWFHRGGEHE